MDTKYEVLFENSQFHFRLVGDGKVIFRGANVASAALAVAAATTARNTVAAADVSGQGDIVDAVTTQALSMAAGAPIVDLSAGVSDDKGGVG